MKSQRYGLIDKMNSRLVIVGDNCIDRYLSPERKVWFGGCGLNVAVHAAHLGAKVSLVSAIGDDNEGLSMKRALEKEGIDTSHLVTLKGKTAFTKIEVINGERRFPHEDMGVQDYFVLDKRMLDFISTFKIVHTTIYYSNVVKRHLKEWHGKGMKVSCDYSDISPQEFIEESAPFVYYGFFSYDKSDAKEMALKLKSYGFKWVILTMGEKGSLAYNGVEYILQEALPTKVIDTTGAGDSFIAGFLVSILSQDSVADGMLHSAALASKVCSHKGTWIPTSSH